ncbi:MAG: glycogen synthase GlgA [Gammaproteobacteria bacterium]|nr:glycogen synthase GlgA [Gammaproteobacteria bacterium]
MAAKKILFVTSEAHPLIKTGGLADVSGSLPLALKKQRHDVRLVLPAYPEVIKGAGKLQTVATFDIAAAPQPVTILEGNLPGSSVKLWLVQCPVLFERNGGPYLDESGRDWGDNALRFATFCRAATEIALDQAGLDWHPDIVHCNDWQSGLVPALLSLHDNRPGTLFTVHNLAYQGLFHGDMRHALQLPDVLWSMDGLEFHGQLSFMKGGLAYADQLTTVSPTYAAEICTAAYGYGLEGLLNHRAEQLTGILNGVDYNLWDPKNDPYIVKAYNAENVRFKQINKLALQNSVGLKECKATPLIGMIGRFVEQKGFDLMLEALPDLLQQQPFQLVVLGSGEARYEEGFRDMVQRYPEHVALTIGYDESHAHRIESGADLFLMPSRFEPSGLNQLYSLRYGTLPIVRRTGGLADSVVDASDENRKADRATGFVFDKATPAALSQCIFRALSLYQRPRLWRKVMSRAMSRDFSWQRSAKAYLECYQRATRD